MSHKKCVNCYYGDLCQCDEVCEDYTPVNEQSIDEEIDNMVEKNRIAFRAEWFRYIEACNS